MISISLNIETLVFFKTGDLISQHVIHTNCYIVNDKQQEKTRWYPIMIPKYKFPYSMC